MRRSPARSRPTRRNPPCARREYWGRGGAGMMFVCSEDRTVLLLLRAEWVEQGGTWGVPGGGIGEGFFSTPMEPIDDPAVFLRKAVQEVEEECGSLPPGFSEAQILGTTQYEDCGFRYRTFIADITAEQKAAWHLVSDDGETDAFVWFPWDDVLSGQPLDDADQHFGVVFTMKNLPVAVASRFGRANPRLRRNPDAPVRFSSGAEAEQAALAARPSVLSSPEFRAWFGKSQVVDADGKPLIVYHGTHSRDAFSVFSDEDAPYRGGLLAFFSSSPVFAEGYGKNVYPVYLRCYDVFDFRDTNAATRTVEYFYEEHGGVRDNEEARRILMSLSGTHPEIDVIDIMDARYSWRDLTEALFLEAVLKGAWPALECEEFVQFLREGWDCDGIVLLEHGAINYGIFEPTQIKSATGNRGTFDPEEADIRHNPRRRVLSRPLSRPARRLRRNPEDAGYILDLMDRLEEFKSSVMEAAGDDPYETTFDPMEYPIDSDTLRSYLDARILGWGASRVVVLLPSGNVAKLPWSDMDVNVDEWERWQEASPEVQQMLLPPLEMVSGAIVFPRAKTVSDRDYDDPELAAARKRWRALWLAGAPGAKAEDFQNTQNWGIYTDPESGAQRVVLIDYAD